MLNSIFEFGSITDRVGGISFGCFIWSNANNLFNLKYFNRLIFIYMKAAEPQDICSNEDNKSR
jgi:hypothetical protein